MSPEQKKKKILVADDDPAILDSITQLLEISGFEVSTTADGETVRALKKNYPDLLLLDIWMSGQDGRDICRYVKAQPATKHIPVIMFSANKDTKRMAQEAGADDFILKPFEMQELLLKIAAHI